MRRRRQQLQVSTFPFLAVLLCAMGSLILLLLVIDRRAKAVARAKALRAAAQAAEEDKRAAAARKAEWERRRQALHALLARQQEELAGRARTADEQGRVRSADLQAERARWKELRRKVRGERREVGNGQEDLDALRQAAQRNAGQTEAARKDVQRLAQQLDALEQTFQDLKLLRRRDRQTYSLVPYQGRRGENRRPIYIECAAAGVIFHPDHHTEADAAGIRAAGERHIHAQGRRTAAVGRKKELPYLLFLVRPEGISTYYRALRALAGLSFDYGYEFVEQDWVLDFSGDEARPGTDWMNAARANPLPQRVRSRKAHPALPPPRPAGQVVVMPRGGPNGGAAGPAGVAGPGVVFGTASPGNASPIPDELRPRRLAARFFGAPGGCEKFGTLPYASPNGGSAVAQESAGPASGGRQPPGDTASARPANAGRQPPGNSASPRGPRPPLAGQVATNAGQPSGGLAGPPGAPAGLTLARGAEANPPGPSAYAADRSPQPGAKSAASVDVWHPLGGMGSAGGTGTPSTAPPAQAGTGAPPSRSDFTALLRREGKGQAVRGAPAPFPTSVDNRDWIIPVECTADAVILRTPKLELPTAVLRADPKAGPLVVAVVRQMIDRRQATVKPGEAPYRPMIRFRVRADGQRSYYVAYPLFEGLGLPMARQDLEAEGEP
jgi:hypothetical protein